MFAALSEDVLLEGAVSGFLGGITGGGADIAFSTSASVSHL